MTQMGSVHVDLGVRGERSVRVQERWVLWHITRACNIECDYCYGSFDGSSYKKMGRDPSELTSERGASLFSEMGEAGIDAVHINGGEPLLRADIVAILEGGRETSVRKWLLTNGTVRGKSFEAIAKDGLVDLLAVSLDTNDASLGDISRERTARVVETLQLLCSWKTEGTLTCRLGVYVVASKVTVKRLEAFARWLESIGVDYVNVQPVFLPPGHPEHALSLSSSDAPLMAAFYDALGRGGNITVSSADMRWLAESSLENGRGVARDCFADRGDYFYVTPSGLVYGCPVKAGRQLALGDLKRSSFVEACRKVRPERACGEVCGDCLGMYEMASGGNARRMVRPK